MVSEGVIAAAAMVSVSLSLPFYLYGAWIMIDRETDNVTWPILTRHLQFILPGLVLTTVPVVTWMGPRLLDQLEGLAILHAFLGLQAYALLAFGITGIVRIFQVKRAADFYEVNDPDTSLDDLHENMSAWRARLRIGVFGYVVFWFGAYCIGVYRFVVLYG